MTIFFSAQSTFRKVSSLLREIIKKQDVQLANREINFNNQSIREFLEARDLATDTVVVAIFVLFLTFLRPFGMHQIDMFYAGFFWSVMCFTGYVIYSPTMFFLSKLLDRNLPERINNKAVRLVLSTLVASVLMGLLAPFIIAQFFDYFDNSYLQSLPMSILYCTVIGGIIAGVSSIKSLMLQQQQLLKQSAEELALESEKVDTIQSQPIESLINELPIAKRGRLICLQMDDHYLNVITDKGEHLLLMRFKDALEKLEHYDGFQTHRSWWVAKDAVVDTKKDGRKLILVLQNGTEVPVSQTYLANTKAVLDLK
ncbi:LytTR family DNA-binding domain-containing protein [Pseudoalteromonas sp. T1lg24]|uniref:LytTR family DNA-binding domain-containing protein n=1 Tax=Pseudoalteromonas sp. T1lg24 TaxID=2077099 RepID=UPI000CF62F49|nr:LytTR family DNA-binding domain-containing protein [Pseudoalteromonas sp. T1lg24]